MEQYKKDIISQNKEFQDIIYPLITNDTVQQMKNFKCDGQNKKYR